MVIIGLCGFQNSGKDTYGNFLVKQFGFVKLSFASATKDVVSNVFGWDRNLLEGDTIISREFREKPDDWWGEKLNIDDFTPRKALQLIGTDIFRELFNHDIWVFIIEKIIVNNPDKNYVISDCRFPNEINMIKKHNGKIIHILRNIPDWYYDYKNNILNINDIQIHKSELLWIKENFDYEIKNNFNSINDFENFINDNVLYILN